MRLGILGLAALTLSGCVLFDAGRRSGPDEFGVVTRAPLSQPPDYALRPPRTGAHRPNEVAPREEARNDLLRVSATSGDSRVALATAANGHGGRNGADGTADTGGLSRGEEALLRQADALEVDPDIRVTIDRESGRVTEDKGLVDKLVFWRGKDQPTGKVIDPKRESERLNRDAALGVPPTGTAAKSQ
jgi:Protein of unknown function (DUF3035)